MESGKEIPQAAIAATSISVVNPDEIKSAYCNNIQFSLTNWDVRMFCTEIEATPTGEPVQIVKANIVMAIGHAEALMKALKTTLDEYYSLNRSTSGSKP